jgi:hypothetical protein
MVTCDIGIFSSGSRVRRWVEEFRRCGPARVQPALTADADRASWTYTNPLKAPDLGLAYRAGAQRARGFLSRCSRFAVQMLIVWLAAGLRRRKKAGRTRQPIHRRRKVAALYQPPAQSPTVLLTAGTSGGASSSGSSRVGRPVRVTTAAMSLSGNHIAAVNNAYNASQPADLGIR